MLGCSFRGRFGNNLFQIAVTASLALTNDNDFIIPTWEYSEYFDYDFKQSDMLTNNPEPRPEDLSLEVYFDPYSSYTPIEYKDKMCLLGSFQSEKYFDFEVVKRVLKFKDSYLNEMKDKYIDKDRRITSIHVRRGDFLFEDDPHINLPTTDYYERAISKVRDKTDCFFVFSDDIDGCKNQFKGDNFIYIEGNTDVQDLMIMSLCNNQITANSSFSWWGAWFSENIIFSKAADNVIITPKDYYKKSFPYHTEDLIPNRWEVI